MSADLNSDAKYPVQDDERCPKCNHDYALCNCYDYLEITDDGVQPPCVNRTGCETPNDCRQHGYCRSPHNAAGQDALADENLKRPHDRREETIDAPVPAAPVIATLRECNVLLDRRLRLEREAELIATERAHLFAAVQHIGAAGKAPRTSSWDISQAIAALLKAREAAEELDPPAAA